MSQKLAFLTMTMPFASCGSHTTFLFRLLPVLLLLLKSITSSVACWIHVVCHLHKKMYLLIVVVIVIIVIVVIIIVVVVVHHDHRC